MRTTAPRLGKVPERAVGKRCRELIEAAGAGATLQKVPLFGGIGGLARNGSELYLHASRINPNRRVLEHVLVPLGVRALHGQQVEILPSNTNQTGSEIIFPDFLPTTLILIWRYRARRALGDTNKILSGGFVAAAKYCGVPGSKSA